MSVPASTPVLSESDVAQADAYWRAANDLSVGQIYLYGNLFLNEPLAPEHIKPRLRDKLTGHKHYSARHGEDMPEIRDGQWPR